jgi:tetratricopeptide (TPR) repeat protein
MKSDLAIVRQRLERRVDEGAPTIALPSHPPPPRRPGSASGYTPPGSAPGSRPGSRAGSGGSRHGEGSAHRATLYKKRAAQIDSHMVEARKHFDSGAFEKARESAEQALMFDPDHPIGLQLLDEIAVEEERQQIAQLVVAARLELQQGQLESAERIVAQAMEVAPRGCSCRQARAFSSCP